MRTPTLGRRRSGLLSAAVVICACSIPATGFSATPVSIRQHLKQLDELLQYAGQQRLIVGAQVAVGSVESPPSTHSLGAIAPGSRQPVDDATQFCIGSCSKPIAAVCILMLADEGVVDLDTPVDRWVPEMGRLVDGSGQPVARVPTLRELLAHRGGIYSQKHGPMTPAQTRAIRNFRLTLSESVRIIGQQPLIAAPGEKYAYSGAGYCVVGLAAERAAKKPFEELLQTKLARPLGLIRTTYFPSANETNIAVSGIRNGQGRTVAASTAPHLAKARLKLPLIGGSIYSTAAETAAFARLVLHRGVMSGQRLLSRESWRQLTRQQFKQQGYGLGWVLTIRNGQISAMRHAGALSGYRSLIGIDFENDAYTVVLWTLANPKNPQSDQLRNALEKLAFGKR